MTIDSPEGYNPEDFGGADTPVVTAEDLATAEVARLMEEYPDTEPDPGSEDPADYVILPPEAAEPGDVTDPKVEWVGDIPVVDARAQNEPEVDEEEPPKDDDHAAEVAERDQGKDSGTPVMDKPNQGGATWDSRREGLGPDSVEELPFPSPGLAAAILRDRRPATGNTEDVPFAESDESASVPKETPKPAKTAETAAKAEVAEAETPQKPDREDDKGEAPGDIPADTSKEEEIRGTVVNESEDEPVEPIKHHYIFDPEEVVTEEMDELVRQLDAAAVEVVPALVGEGLLPEEVPVDESTRELIGAAQRAAIDYGQGFLHGHTANQAARVHVYSPEGWQQVVANAPAGDGGYPGAVYLPSGDILVLQQEDSASLARAVAYAQVLALSAHRVAGTTGIEEVRTEGDRYFVVSATAGIPHISRVGYADRGPDGSFPAFNQAVAALAVGEIISPLSQQSSLHGLVSVATENQPGSSVIDDVIGWMVDDLVAEGLSPGEAVEVAVRDLVEGLVVGDQDGLVEVLRTTVGDEGVEVLADWGRPGAPSIEDIREQLEYYRSEVIQAVDQPEASTMDEPRVEASSPAANAGSHAAEETRGATPSQGSTRTVDPGQGVPSSSPSSHDAADAPTEQDSPQSTDSPEQPSSTEAPGADIISEKEIAQERASVSWLHRLGRELGIHLDKKMVRTALEGVLAYHINKRLSSARVGVGSNRFAVQRRGQGEVQAPDGSDTPANAAVAKVDYMAVTILPGLVLDLTELLPGFKGPLPVGRAWEDMRQEVLARLLHKLSGEAEQDTVSQQIDAIKMAMALERTQRGLSRKGPGAGQASRRWKETGQGPPRVLGQVHIAGSPSRRQAHFNDYIMQSRAARAADQAARRDLHNQRMQWVKDLESDDPEVRQHAARMLKQTGRRNMHRRNGESNMHWRLRRLNGPARFDALLRAREQERWERIRHRHVIDRGRAYQHLERPPAVRARE